jgi:NAD(P)-dependent dehydrogenase (short-subunit alcohol dehydrogenase family)
LNTPGIDQTLSPGDWQVHHFGMPPERWVRLRERSYWVTGAGTGFGQAMAVALACAGAQVFLTGRRPEKLAETVDEVRRLGGEATRCHAVPADITDDSEVERASAFIRGRSQALHGLVNNAAVPQRRNHPWPLQEGPGEAWQQMLAVNVTAAWRVTAAALPHAIQGGEVRALFVTSEAGWASTTGVGPYNVSKAALNSLGASFAEECAARYPGVDVQINVLVPGEARTEMNQGTTRSPYVVVPMVLALLSHPAGGPNGRFFHADGCHLAFAYSPPHDRPLLPAPAAPGGVAPPRANLLRRLGRRWSSVFGKRP